MINLYPKSFFKAGQLGLFLVVVLLGTGQVFAQPGLQHIDPMDLYDRMLASKWSYEYQGIMTYEQGGHIRSFNLSSAGDLFGRKSSIVSRDGPMSTRVLQFPTSCGDGTNSTASELSSYYNFYLKGKSRIAGRNAYEIVLSPVDGYRLGYSYLIDVETGLRLRSVSMLPDRRVLDRAQFIDIDIAKSATGQSNGDAPKSPYLEINQPSLETSSENSHSTVLKCTDLLLGSGWKSEFLPDGFVLKSSKIDSGRVSLLYTDGLSTMSLFIEPLQSGNALQPSYTRRGATLAYIDYVNQKNTNYLITLVGEVPLLTAQRVVNSLSKG